MKGSDTDEPLNPTFYRLSVWKLREASAVMIPKILVITFCVCVCASDCVEMCAWRTNSVKLCMKTFQLKRTNGGKSVIKTEMLSFMHILLQSFTSQRQMWGFFGWFSFFLLLILVHQLQTESANFASNISAQEPQSESGPHSLCTLHVFPQATCQALPSIAIIDFSQWPIEVRQQNKIKQQP